MGLQVIFTFILFLSFFFGGERVGAGGRYPCLSLDMRMKPSSRVSQAPGGEGGTEFRGNFMHPNSCFWNAPPPPNSGVLLL